MSTMQHPPKPNTPGSTPAPKKPTAGKKSQPPPSAKGSGGKASRMSREEPPKAITADDMAADFAEKSMGGSTGAGGMPSDPEGGDGMQDAGGERLSRLSKGQDDEETMNTTAEQIELFQDLSDRLSKGQLSVEEQQEFMRLLRKGQGETETIEQPDRYQELRGKIAAGEELTKSERDEFADLLKAKDGEEPDGDEDEDEGEEDEGDDDEEPTKKSRDAGVTEDDLQKAMDSLQSLALGQSSAAPDRRAELAEKLSKGQISAEETVELQDLLKSMTSETTTTTEDAGDTLHKSLTEQLEEVPEVKETVDATPFLKRLASSLDAMLDTLHQDLTKSESSRRMFNVGLAKALYGVGKVVQSTEALVKSLQSENTALKQQLGELGERVQVVETTPLPFKGRTGTGTRALNKSFGAGGQGADGELTSEQIDQGLEILLSKSMTEGDPPGVNLQLLVAKSESAHRLSPNEVQCIKNALAGK